MSALRKKALGRMAGTNEMERMAMIADGEAIGGDCLGDRVAQRLKFLDGAVGSCLQQTAAQLTG